MANLEGKVAVITGAGRGIGRAIALRFARAGADVAICARSSDDLRKVSSDIQALGRNCLLLALDVSSPDEVRNFCDKIIAEFGRVDILVNNAGLSIDAPFLDMREEDWDRVIEVNLKGPFLVSQAVGRRMVAAKRGRIVNISATSAVVARAGNANYAASKAGLNMLTQSMALELGPFVNVNSVALGFVDSDLVRELFSPDEISEAADGVPLKRLTTYEETSAFVLMLASNVAGFVTGQTIPFDGGRVMR